jgi:hypothetical protein
MNQKLIFFLKLIKLIKRLTINWIIHYSKSLKDKEKLFSEIKSIILLVKYGWYLLVINIINNQYLKINRIIILNLWNEIINW